MKRVLMGVVNRSKNFFAETAPEMYFKCWSPRRNYFDTWFSSILPVVFIAYDEVCYPAIPWQSNFYSRCDYGAIIP